jgi:hypothetical protein
MGSQELQRMTATVGKVATKDANNCKGSQHLQRTTATVGKVAIKGRKQQYGKPAFAEDDRNSREGSNKGTQTTVREASIYRGR